MRRQNLFLIGCSLSYLTTFVSELPNTKHLLVASSLSNALLVLALPIDLYTDNTDSTPDLGALIDVGRDQMLIGMVGDILIGAGVSLGNPWMLAFGLLAIIPILVHLWSRQRFELRRFAAFEFLQRAVRQHARRIHAEQWLLLALRCLALLLLAFALADPRWESEVDANPASATKSGTLWIVVVDNSYSMDARIEGVSRLATACEELSQLIDELPAGDAMMLMTMGHRVEVLIGEPVFSHDELKGYVQQIEISPGTASLATTLEKTRQLLLETQLDQQQLEHSRVVVMTDLGTSTWNVVNEEPIRQAFREIGEKATIGVWDVASRFPTQSQQAIREIRFSNVRGVTGESIPVDVVLEGCQTERGTPVTLEVRVGGRQLFQRRVVWGEEPELQVPLQLTFAEPGNKLLEFRINSDALPFDNVRYASLPIRPRLRVLLVGPTVNANRTLEVALQPEPRLDGSLEISSIGELELPGVDVHLFDVVILNDLARFDRRTIDSLDRFTNEGGGLILAAGPRADVASWNRLLGQIQSSPAVHLAEQATDGEYRFDPLEYRHPVVESFRGFPNAGLLTVPVWKFWRLDLAESSILKAERVLGYTNGDTAIVAIAIGRGACLLCTTPLAQAPESETNQEPWNALPAWPSYVPIVGELLSASIASQIQERNVTVGDSLRLTRDRENESLPSLIGPTGDVLEADRIDGETGIQFGSLEAVGFYRLQQDDSLRTQPFRDGESWAVNHAGEDSCLEAIDGNRLPTSVALLQTLAAEEELEVAPAGANAWYPWLLVLVLCFSFIELIVARYRGREIEVSELRRSLLVSSTDERTRKRQNQSQGSTAKGASTSRRSRSTAATQFMHETRRFSRTKNGQ